MPSSPIRDDEDEDLDEIEENLSEDNVSDMEEREGADGRGSGRGGAKDGDGK